MMNGAMLKAACEGLKLYYRDASECEKIVIQSAIASTATGAALGAIPAVGAGMAQVAAYGVVFSMYVRINNKLGISFAKEFLKSIVTVIVAELGATLGLTIAASILSLIPIIGTVGSSIISASAQFGFVYLCGYLYIIMLTKWAKTGNKGLPGSGEAGNDMKEFIKETISETDWDSVKEEAMNIRKEAKDSGEFDKAEEFCVYCGAKRTKTDKFCPKCGEQLLFDAEPENAD